MTPTQVKAMLHQRQARLEAMRQPPKTVFDCIDTSMGPDACHRWKGSVTETWSKQGRVVGDVYRQDGTKILAHRAVVEDTFGVKLVSGPHHDQDIVQICGHFLCCNIQHLAITPRGKGLDEAVPVCEYFTEERVHALLGKQGAAREGNNRVHVREAETGTVLR